MDVLCKKWNAYKYVFSSDGDASKIIFGK